MSIENLINAVKQYADKARFVGVTYRTKESGEKSRRVLILGANYVETLQKSILELGLTINEEQARWDATQRQAGQELLASLNKSLLAQSQGQQNEDYTKRDCYTFLVDGIAVNTNDNTLELRGLQQSKVVLEQGEFKSDNRRPKTVAKDTLRARLPIGKYRSLCLDAGLFTGARLNGETLELE